MVREGREREWGERETDRQTDRQTEVVFRSWDKISD